MRHDKDQWPALGSFIENPNAKKIDIDDALSFPTYCIQYLPEFLFFKAGLIYQGKCKSDMQKSKLELSGFLPTGFGLPQRFANALENVQPYRNRMAIFEPDADGNTPSVERLISLGELILWIKAEV